MHAQDGIRSVIEFSGSPLPMPTDRELITLSDLVRRAAAIVDPPGEDPAVEEFAVRFEDVDEPVRSQLDGLEERVLWGVDEDAPIVMAQAITLYLAHRLDQFDDEPESILRLAARSEFDGKPPENVIAWLEDQGVTLT
jgi:hypothetical protein